LASEQYVVTRDQGDWAVRYNGDQLGRFPSCPRAIRAAVEAADVSHTEADAAEVIVERTTVTRFGCAAQTGFPAS
jgi:hypothetical protein